MCRLRLLSLQMAQPHFTYSQHLFWGGARLVKKELLVKSKAHILALFGFADLTLTLSTKVTV